MTGVPPPRWKVVERGRRLEVIDTRAGPERPAARAAGGRPGLPRKLRFDGTLGWTTHPFYDDRGPRAVVLDGGPARWIGGVTAGIGVALIAVAVLFGLPAIVVIAAILGSSAKQIRGWITRRLDSLAT